MKSFQNSTSTIVKKRSRNKKKTLSLPNLEEVTEIIKDSLGKLRNKDKPFKIERGKVGSKRMIRETPRINEIRRKI